MFQSVVATIPETIVAILALYMYYRYADDGLKKSFGIGYLYASDYAEGAGTPINAVLGMDEMILRESREETTREYAENIKVAGAGEGKGSS